MSPLSRLLAACAPILILASCLPTKVSPASRTRVRDDGPVQIYAALTNFPVGTGCLRFTSTPTPVAPDGKIYEQLIAVTPGAPAKVGLKGLPYNMPLVIMAEAFAEACADVHETTQATWMNEAPVYTTLVFGQYGNGVSFNMWPMGPALVPIDFTYFTLAPLSQAFGSAILGFPTESSNRKFTLVNQHTGATGTLSASVSGPQASSFEVKLNTCTGSLAASVSCTVEIRCVPKVRGALNATLQITGTPGGTVKATLTGTGIAPAALSLGSIEEDFGYVYQGQASPYRTVTVTNTGDLATGIPTVTLTGHLPEGAANQYEIPAATNTCTAALNGGQSCTMQLRFAPKAGNAPGFTASDLTVEANPGSYAGSNLVGTAVGSPGFTVTPTSFTFPASATSVATSQAFTFKNTSGITMPSVTATFGGTNGLDFTSDGSDCNQTLLPGASCTTYIKPMPTQPGLRSGTLTVASSGLPGFTITIAANYSITAPALLVANPASFNFGTWPGPSAPKGQIIKVTNNSLVSLPGIVFNTDATGIFKVANNGCSAYRPAGSVCDVSVTFDPPVVTANTSYSFSLVGTSNTANKVTIPLSGTGTP